MFVKKIKILLIYALYLIISIHVSAQISKNLDSLFRKNLFREYIDEYNHIKDTDPKCDHFAKLMSRSLLYLSKSSDISHYLIQAKNSSIKQLLYLFEWAYLNYDYDKCHKIINDLRSLSQKKKIEIFYIKDLEQRLNKAERLLLNVDYIDLISAKKYGIDNFTDGINIPTYNGKINILWKQDSLSDYIPVVTFTGSRNLRRIVTKEKNGNSYLEYQVFSNGLWEKTPVSMNYIDDQNCTSPFMLPDGITIYFASKSPYGVGGYDINISRLDIQSGVFLKPTTMGMPYNSPYNDYLLVIDGETKINYLVSDRMQTRDSVMVYTFKYTNNRVPDSLSVDKKISKAIITNQDTVVYSNVTHIDFNKEAYDLNFKITPNIIIHELSDFVSQKAKSLYMKYVKYNYNIQTIRKSIDYIIKQYRKEISPLEKSNLSVRILDYRNTIMILEQERDNILTECKIEEITANK